MTSPEYRGARGSEQPRRIGFAFDYIDPGSYLASELLDRWIGPSNPPVELDWRPLELRPPPTSLLNPRDPRWSELTKGMMVEAAREGIGMVDVGTLPWTRKAHELALLAREKGCFDRVHRALFEAHFRTMRDIGRIDVLVEIGKAHGLDSAETRTVLGTDRFSSSVTGCAGELRALGVRGVPTLWVGEARLEGFQSAESLRSFLAGALPAGHNLTPEQ